LLLLPTCCHCHQLLRSAGLEMDSWQPVEEPWPELPSQGIDADPWPAEDTQAWEASISCKKGKKGKKRAAEPVWAWDDNVSKVAHVCPGTTAKTQTAALKRSVNLGFAPGSIETALSAERNLEPTVLSHHAKNAIDPTILNGKLKDGRSNNKLKCCLCQASEPNASWQVQMYWLQAGMPPTGAPEGNGSSCLKFSQFVSAVTSAAAAFFKLSCSRQS
jgi:hypothetical protein